MKPSARAGAFKLRQSPMTTLERLQSDFAAALVDPACVRDILPALTAPDGKIVERLALYRGNILAAQEKALANAYPTVHALVGDEFFAALALAYGDTFPSTSGNLNLFGEQLGAFVATFRHTRALPYLGDVARLDWAVHRARDAVDVELLSPASIAEMSPQALLATKFRVNPACAWFDSRYPIASIWLAHQPQATVALPEHANQAQCALVVRPRWEVAVVESNAGEIAALEHLGNGADMGTAIQAAILADAIADLPGTLARWLDLGVFIGAQA
jgi:hypothetical protein